MKDVERPDIDRLPAKYRRYIEHLEHRLGDFDKLQAQSVPTKVEVDGGVNGPKLYLPDATSVRFHVKHATYARAHFDVMRTEPWSMGRFKDATALEIRGAHSMHILPSSSNLVYAVINERD